MKTKQNTQTISVSVAVRPDATAYWIKDATEQDKLDHVAAWRTRNKDVPGEIVWAEIQMAESAYLSVPATLP